MQEYRLKKNMIKLLQLVKGTTDCVKIETTNENELAETIFEVMKSRCSTKEGSLSIAEVDRSLNSLVDVELKDSNFAILYQKCSALNFKW
jgi:hypothetical protein